MNRRQRGSIAKYLYDVSKVTLAVTVIGNIATGRFEGWLLGWGFLCAFTTFLAAYLLEENLEE